VFSWMLCRVALVRTDVSEELSASFIRVTRIGELGTTLAVASNRRTVRRNTVTASVPGSPILVTLMKEALVTASVIPSSPILVTLMKEAPVTASVVPSSQTLVSLMKEALSSSETSQTTPF
jgi:hypothetical protein